jgi:L-ribulose-5-phosphate 3-epimerase
MKKTDLNQRLAVCSWSLRPASPAELLGACECTGISRLQLALDPLRENPAVWGQFATLVRQRGVSIVSGMFGTVGEDYTTLETIKRTGGVVRMRRGTPTGKTSRGSPRSPPSSD